MNKSHQDIIGIWPTLDALAKDVGAKPGTVSKWKTRNRIPSQWWIAVSNAAKQRGENVSIDHMARITTATTPEQ